MPPRLRNARVWGENGIYAKGKLDKPCGSVEHGEGGFLPICFICRAAIGITGDRVYKAYDDTTLAHASESDVEWTRSFRAIIFNRSRDIALSEVGHIIYQGPWLELLKLPVKDESRRTTMVEFYPLCFHRSEEEVHYKIFGCTLHATCWQLFEDSLGGKVPQGRLPAIVQILREQMYGSIWECKDWTWYNLPIAPVYNSLYILDEPGNSSDPKNIPSLRKAYRSCATRNHKTKKDADFARLYAALPAEIKLMILEYVEEKPLLKSFDMGHTLTEYWQKRVFREYQELVFDAAHYKSEEIDWQRLRGEVQKLLSAANWGLKNRRRIMNIIKMTRQKYIETPKVEPTPEGLRISSYDQFPGERKAFRYK